MSKGIRTGVDSVAHNGKRGCVGVDNIARKIVKVYVGVDNLAKLGYMEEQGEDEVVFSISGTWTVPDGVTSIDIFCVGGGGGAGGGFYNRTVSGTAEYNGEERTTYMFGASGGSGYTSTLMGISVTPGEVLSIFVGAGGQGGISMSSTGNVSLFQLVNGGNGSASYVEVASGSYGIDIIRARGGYGGTCANPTPYTSKYYNGCSGARGGSGSGAGGSQMHQKEWTNGTLTRDLYWADCIHDEHANEGIPFGCDGYDGGSGGGVDLWEVQWVPSYYEDCPNARKNVYTGGAGQGFTTRKFREDGETVYAQVGIVEPNSGNSGPSGSDLQPFQITSQEAKAGSSGVVIFRLHYS